MTEPQLTFAPDAWRKLARYAQLCPFEIGGLGELVVTATGYLVTDIHLVRQDVNDIATRLDGDAVNRRIEDLVDAGRDPGVLRLWWHSHAREATFWSGEDEETISLFRNDGMLSLVTNHELRMLARFDRYDPRTTEWVWVDRPAPLADPEPAEAAAIRRAIAEAVRYVPVARRQMVV